MALDLDLLQRLFLHRRFAEDWAGDWPAASARTECRLVARSMKRETEEASGPLQIFGVLLLAAQLDHLRDVDLAPRRDRVTEPLDRIGTPSSSCAFNSSMRSSRPLAI
ncbi:MAG TPA: hypothetical protein VGL86_21405 [Polyangia bacterium]